jgi:hypothetical protein
MELKNRDVIDIFNSLNTLARERLPIKLSWRIETSRRALEPFYETAIAAVEQAKVRKALKNPDGTFVLAKGPDGNSVPGTMMFPREEIEDLNKEINSVLDEVVEISNITLKLSEFPDNLEMSAESIKGLDKVVKDE